MLEDTAGCFQCSDTYYKSKSELVCLSHYHSNHSRLAHTFWKCECHTILFFFFTFGLLPSDVPQPITCLRLTPSSWASSFLTQIYKLTVIFHKIHKSPFRFSSKLPACHFEPQGPSTQIFTVLLLNMFCLKQSQFGHSGYTSKSI